MAWSLSTLAAYTKENADKFYTGLVTGAPTLDLVASEGVLLTGIKTAENIPLLETDAVLQDAVACGFNASGTTAITQRAVTVGAIKVNEEFCLNELEAKFTQLAMKQGSMPEEMPAAIEAAYVEQKISKIDYKMEVLAWQGDTTSGNSDLNKADGYIKIIDAATGVAHANADLKTGTITATIGAATVAGVGTLFTTEVAVGDKIYSGNVLIGTVLSIASNTALTLTANGAAAATAAAYKTVSVNFTGTPILGALNAGNVLAAMDLLALSVPQSVMDSSDPTYVFMGTDAFRLALIALKNANLFHYTYTGDEVKTGIYLPGMPWKIKPVPGLSGTGRMFVIQAKNMVVGTDLQNEWEEFKFWFSDDDDKLKFKARWKIGFQIMFPSQVAQYTGA